jgi:sterol 14-demethylase
MQVQNLIERALRRARPLPRGLREPPQLSGGLPVLGHAVEFVSSTIELLRRAERELGEVAAFNVATKRMVALFGPEAHEAVFRAPDTQLNPAEAYKIMTPVFGKDLVYDAPPEKMAEQLKMLLPALKDRRMRTYGESIVGEVEASIAGWGQDGIVDIVDYCRVLTNYTSSRCLLGHEFRERMTGEFAAVYHDLERGVTPIAYLNAHLPIPSFIKRDRARVRLVEMITRIIAERRREGREGEDFLQTLMEARYSDGRGLSEHEITGMLLAAMFAGHHTSSVTTAWTLIELLRNPSYFERVVAQIDDVFGDGKPVTFQALRELTLTEYAVKEALRLHPPLFMLVRVVHQDFVYKDYYVPAGTWVLVSPTVSHLIPSLFADPERFDPDRFAPPREEDKRDFAYIPFGGGRHKCLGNAFAILQVKAILAMLLGRYEFALAGDPIDSDFHGLVVGPKEPCRLRYRRRQQAAQGVMPSGNGHAAHAHAAMAAGGHGLGLGMSMGTAMGTGSSGGCPFHAMMGQPTPEPAASPPPPSESAAPAAAPVATEAPAQRRFSIVLDRDLCQGHAVCVGEAPELFQIGDDGKVTLRIEHPGPTHHAKAALAARYCPTRSIKIVEE